MTEGRAVGCSVLSNCQTCSQTWNVASSYKLFSYTVCCHFLSGQHGPGAALQPSTVNAVERTAVHLKLVRDLCCAHRQSRQCHAT